MAKQGKDMPGFEVDYSKDWRPQDEIARKRLAELRATGKVIQFQRFDGYAQYFVESESPLVLRLIPYADAYEIEPATMRGLRLSDVRAMLKREAAMSKLFGGR